jgi:hypothetical protein
MLAHKSEANDAWADIRGDHQFHFAVGHLVTLVIAAVVPLSLLLYSNSRITDAKETLRVEIGETKQTLRGEIQLGFERISNKVDHLAGEVATLKELMATHLREHHNIH